MEKEKKEHVSGRVSVEAIKNIVAIADTMKWSFNQTLEEAMKRLKAEDIIFEMRDKVLNIQTKQS